MMLDPALTAAKLEELLAAEAEAIQHEIARIDAGIRSVGWDRPAPRRSSVAEDWGRLARVLGTVEDVDEAARACLVGNRAHLVERLRG